MADLSELFLALLTAIGTAVTVMISYWFTERSKRRWSMSDELWRLKYQAISDSIRELMEFRLIVHMIRRNMLYVPDASKGDEPARTIAGWELVNDTYFHEDSKFIHTFFKDDGKEGLASQVQRARMYESDKLEGILVTKYRQWEQSLVGLKLIIVDKGIVNEMLELMKAIDDCHLNKTHGPFCDEISKKIENVVDRAKKELEETRRGSNRMPEHNLY